MLLYLFIKGIEQMFATVDKIKISLRENRNFTNIAEMPTFKNLMRVKYYTWRSYLGTKLLDELKYFSSVIYNY